MLRNVNLIAHVKQKLYICVTKEKIFTNIKLETWKI